MCCCVGMLKKKAFVKKTRRGNLVKVVREHYLRDDVKYIDALGHSDMSVVVEVGRRWI